VLTEILSMSGIIAGSFAFVWFAKNKYQPGIERRLSEIEKHTRGSNKTFSKIYK
jgi:hypothetical protein